jgi:hypothetical protein
MVGISAPSAAVTLGEVKPVERISFGGTYLQEPRLAVNDDGDAVAVWRQDDGAPTYIWVSHAHAGGAWSDAVRISAYTASDPQIPRVAAGPDGSFLVTWTLGAGDFYFTWYHKATGWDAEAVASVSPGHSILDMEIAADGRGNAFAVVLESVSASINLSALTYTAGVGWGSMLPLESSTDQVEPTTYSIAADEGGNATAVWVQVESTYKSILANRYTPGTGWMGVTHLEADANRSHGGPKLAGKPSGEAVVAWEYSDGVRQRIGSNTYLPGSGWAGFATVDDTVDGNNGAVGVAFAGQNAVVGWTRLNGSNYDVNAAAGLGSSWGSRANLSWEGTGSAVRVSGGGGTAVVSWGELPGSRLFGARYVEGQGWSARGRLFEGDPTYSVGSWASAADGAGNAVVAWYAPSPVYVVYAVWVRDSVGPSVSITTPGPFSVVGEPSVEVTGSVEQGAWVAANGVVARVDEFGAYSARVPLHAGSNAITVVARDAAGNEATAAVFITYDDPVPALEASLAAAEAHAAALEAALNDSTANLTQARADVAAAQAALSSLESDQSATAADLAGARGNLSAANQRVADLETHVSTLSAQLANANGRIDALAGGGSPAPTPDNTLALVALVLAALAAVLAALGLLRGKGGKKAPPPSLEPLPPEAPKP